MISKLARYASIYTFADLNHAYLMTPTQDAVIFTSQGASWDQRVANSKTLAICRGLKSMNFIDCNSETIK